MSKSKIFYPCGIHSILYSPTHSCHPLTALFASFSLSFSTHLLTRSPMHLLSHSLHLSRSSLISPTHSLPNSCTSPSPTHFLCHSGHSLAHFLHLLTPFTNFLHLFPYLSSFSFSLHSFCSLTPFTQALHLLPHYLRRFPSLTHFFNNIFIHVLY